MSKRDASKKGKSSTILISKDESVKTKNKLDFNKNYKKVKKNKNKIPWDESEINKINEEDYKDLNSLYNNKKIDKYDLEWNTTFDAISDLVFILDNDFTLTKVNKAVCDLLGKEENELIGKKCYKLIHGKNKPLINCPCLKTFKTRKSETETIFDHELDLHLQVTNSPIFDDLGNIRGCVHIGKNISQQKKYEQKIKESEEKYRTIFENINDALIIHDFNGKIIEINGNTVNLFGFKSKELIGKNIKKIICEEKFRTLKNRIKDLKKTGKLVFNSYQKSKDGKLIPVSISAKIVTREGNGIIQSFIRDITKQNENENALIKSEKKFQTYIENSPTSIFITDEKGKYQYVNKAGIKLTGYTNNELLKMSISELAHPDDYEKFIKKCPELLKKGKIKLEVSIKKKDGSKKYIILNAVKISNKGYMGYCTDITERQKRENENIYLKEYNEEILQSIKSGIVATDQDLKILTWNKYMEDSYGIVIGEIIGKKLFRAIPSFKRKKLSSAIKEILTNNKLFKEYNVKIKTKNCYKFYNITFSPRVDKNQKNIGILITLDDITELSEISKKLNTIYDLNSKMILSKNEDEIINIGLDAIQKVLKFNHCSILFLDKIKNELYVRAHRGYSENIDNIRFPINRELGFVTLAFNCGKLINAPDVRNEKRYYEFHSKIKSNIVIPLNLRGKPIGVLNVESNKLNAFNEGDENLLKTLANEISTALSNHKYVEETKRKANALLSIFKISEATSSTLKLNEVFKILYDQLSNVIDNQNVYIALIDKIKNELQFKLEVEDGKFKRKRKRKLKNGLSEYVIYNKKPLIINNEIRNFCKRVGVKPGGKDSKSWMGVPIIVKNKAIGILTIQDYKHENSYDEEQLNIIQTIADQLGSTIENSKLYIDLKKRHNELAKAYKNLTQMEKMKSEFLAVTSHEFGTPITILKGNISLFLSGILGELTDLQKKKMNSLNAGVDRLTKLRSQTLLLSQLDTGQLYLKKEHIQLDEFVKSITNDVKILAKERKQKIITNLQNCEIYADKKRIKELIENLISNAIKYSGKGSKIEINLDKGSNEILLTVKDNGNGIPKKHLAKIFKRFYLGHSFLHHKEGTGLGLAIVKSIVEAHKGKVWCESDYGKGATFFVKIPNSSKFKIGSEKN